jgi:phosphatidylglycerol---prolipoprotein diacylglyceryl transferase
MLFAHSSLAGAWALPYFAVPHLNVIWGLKIEPFGVLVALGVLYGTRLLDKYSAWHRGDEEHTRGVTWWLLISGFLGAHLFDVVAYQWDKLAEDPLLLVKVTSGISSYGGFIGGCTAFAIYVWWKRLPPRLWADISMVGMLPAFTIGRIGCTIVHDHPGSPTTSWFGFDYPASFTANLGYSTAMRLHNLALYELMYLIPINALVMWLAFRKRKRMPAGFLAVLIAVLYAPVRFFLDYLRPTSTDPRYATLTFAQWSSILAFGVALYAATRIFKNGTPALTTDDPLPEKKGKAVAAEAGP